MAKYYVESGTLQLVTEAEDARGAALWAVHRCLEQVLPICPDDPLTPQQKDERIRQRGCYVLAETIRTSEKGFGSRSADVHDTAELFVEWNQLIMAMSRLEKRLQAVC
jgi:hypothetical protein